MSKNLALDLHKLADLSSVGIKFEPCSLTIMDEIPYRVAERLCRGIGGFHDASKWWLGDIQIFADDLYGQDRAAQLMEATGRSYHTLENYRWVSSHVAIPRRRAHVPHSYHAEIASLPPDDQIDWLDRIDANGWKLVDLREHLRAERKAKAQVEQPAWSDATVEPDVDKVMKLAKRIANEANPTGSGTFLIDSEVVVQLRAAFGMEEK